jgi:hypothetical protein
LGESIGLYVHVSSLGSRCLFVGLDTNMGD